MSGYKPLYSTKQSGHELIYFYSGLGVPPLSVYLNPIEQQQAQAQAQAQAPTQTQQHELCIEIVVWGMKTSYHISNNRITIEMRTDPRVEWDCDFHINAFHSASTTTTSATTTMTTTTTTNGEVISEMKASKQSKLLVVIPIEEYDTKLLEIAMSKRIMLITVPQKIA